MISNSFYENRAIYEIYNVEKFGGAREITDYYIIRLMHFACWVSKVTSAYPSCMGPRARTPILTQAHAHTRMHALFPRQKLLHERASMLRHSYVGCLVQNIASYLTGLCSNYHVVSLMYRFSKTTRFVFGLVLLLSGSFLPFDLICFDIKDISGTYVLSNVSTF
jgi:hypothetical protein